MVSSLCCLVLLLTCVLVVDTEGATEKRLVFSEMLDNGAVFAGFNLLNTSNTIPEAQLVVYNTTGSEPIGSYILPNCVLSANSHVATKSYNRFTGLDTSRYTESCFIICLHLDGSISSIESIKPVDISLGPKSSHPIDDSEPPFYFVGSDRNMNIFGNRDMSGTLTSSILWLDDSGVPQQDDYYESIMLSVVSSSTTEYDRALVWATDTDTSDSDSAVDVLTLELNELGSQSLYTLPMNSSLSQLGVHRHGTGPLFAYALLRHNSTSNVNQEGGSNGSLANSTKLTLWKFGAGQNSSVPLHTSCVLSWHFYLDSIFVVSCVEDSNGSLTSDIIEVSQLTLLVISTTTVTLKPSTDVGQLGHMASVRAVLDSSSLLFLVSISPSEPTVEFVKAKVRVCPAGSAWAKSTSGSRTDSECSPCTSLSFSRDPLSTTCEACPAGTEANRDSTSCFACTGGTFREKYMDKCEFCRGFVMSDSHRYPVFCYIKPQPGPPLPSIPPVPFVPPPFKPTHGGTGDAPTWVIAVIVVGCILGVALLVFSIVKFIRLRAARTRYTGLPSARQPLLG